MGTGAGPTYALYTINLGSGVATPLGNITPSGSTVIRGIAAVPSAVANINSGKFFATIQAAINDAQTLSGHTIVVNAGTFDELVTVNKSVSIRGARVFIDARVFFRGTYETVVRGALSGGTRTTAFNVTADGVTIDGFTIQDTNNPNLFGSGIVLGAGTSGARIRDNIIQNNIIGLSLANKIPSKPAVIERNLFANNNQPGPLSGTAIYSDQFNAGGSLTSVLIDNNSFNQNANAGVILGSTSAGSQSNIAISNNIMAGNGNAILLFNLSNAFVTANIMTASAGSQLVVGGGVNGLDISENFILDGTTRGIRIGDFGGGSTNSNVTVGSNFIQNNPTAGLEIDPNNGAVMPYTGALKAELNWWGDVSGPDDCQQSGRNR